MLVSIGRVSPQGCEIELIRAPKASRLVATLVATAAGFKGVPMCIRAVRLINTS